MLKSLKWTPGRRFHTLLLCRINLLEFPKILLCTELDKVTLDGLIGADVAHRCDLTVHQLCIAHAVIPAFDDVLL
jgi:hypothetical protein